MSVFDSFGKVGAKAKEWSDITKLNSQISDEQKKIDECYKTIGKLYVSKHSNDCESEFSAAVAVIMESSARIDGYRKQIQTAKGIRICPQCGAEIPVGTLFCSSCGCRQQGEVNPENTVKCQKCGAVISTGMKFCTNCGNPMTVAEQASVSSESAPPEPQGQTCSVCGAVVPDGYAFCTNCGTPVGSQPALVGQVVCPSCGAQVEEGIAFCTNCGKSLNSESGINADSDKPVEETPDLSKKTCPSCGADIEEGAAFCTNCGKPLKEEKRQVESETKSEEKQEEFSSGKICLYCGAEVPSGFAFCTSCGRPMNVHTSEAEESNI